MVEFEFPFHKIQFIKLVLHIAQSVAIFVGWCLCIAVMKSSADIDGRIGWYFGLCFLSIPAIIYLTMTPRFPRTRRFANAYVMLVVDILFMLLWLSAFAAVASYNGTGKCKGGCGVSGAVVAFGVFAWLFFILTMILSIISAVYYRRNGYLPGLSHEQLGSHVTGAQIDPDKEAFSTAPHDDEYAPVHDTDDHDLHDMDGYGGSTGEGSRYDMGGSTAYTSTMGHDHDDLTSGYGGSSYGGGSTIGPSGRVKFPEGNYTEV